MHLGGVWVGIRDLRLRDLGEMEVKMEMEMEGDELGDGGVLLP